MFHDNPQSSAYSMKNGLEDRMGKVRVTMIEGKFKINC